MLEAGGVVRRRRLPPPAGSQVYELTERGADLEPVFNALAAWGTRSPAPPPPTSWSWWPNTVIDEAARAAGRDRAAIRRICNIGGERTRSPLAGAGDDDQQIVGSPDHWVDVPTRLAVEVGFSAFVLWGEPEETRLRTLAGEIDPAVRAGRRWRRQRERLPSDRRASWTGSCVPGPRRRRAVMDAPFGRRAAGA